MRGIGAGNPRPIETNPYVRGAVIPLACALSAFAAAYSVTLAVWKRITKSHGT